MTLLVLTLMLLSATDLTETTELDALQVTRLMDAASTGPTVLMNYMEIRGKLIPRYALYNFEKKEAVYIKDARIEPFAKSIVAHDGAYYILGAGIKLFQVSSKGLFQGILRLSDFEGWEENVSVNWIEQNGETILMSYERQDEEGGIFLAKVDLTHKKIDTIHGIQPSKQKYLYAPMDNQMLRLSLYTTEIALVDQQMKKVKTLRPSQAVLEKEVHDALRETQKEKAVKQLQPLDRPMIWTGSGFSLKYLKTHDGAGERLDKSINRSLFIGKDHKILISGEFILAQHRGKSLLLDIAEQTVHVN